MSVKRPITDVWCRTDTDDRKVTFLWTIDHFSGLRQGTDECIKSSIFSCRNDREVQWRLNLYPNGTEDYQDHVSIFLEPIWGPNSKRNEIISHFVFNIIDKEGVKRKELAVADHVFKWKKDDDDDDDDGDSGDDEEVDDCVWGFSDFVLRTELFNPALQLLTDDMLTIYCEVSYEDTINRSGRVVDFKRQKQCLVDAFAGLYNSVNDKDIVFLVDDKKFCAHKLVLKSRSPVFAAMFDTDMKEKSTNQVIITDIDKDVFEVMIKYIYTACIDKETRDMSKELLAAANKYDIKDLKKLCEDIIAGQLSVDTVCDVLELADIHSARNLKDSALAFIKDRTQSVLKTKGWKELKNPDLLREVTEAIANFR